MPGPHWLPADTDEGDWIEVGMMGAYSNALRTRFNGFASERMALLRDDGWRMAAAGHRRRARPGGVTGGDLIQLWASRAATIASRSAA